MLTEPFCQDVLEEYFGRQRGIGQRNENPTIFQFGYNDNIIRMQRSVVNFIGNTRCKYKNKKATSWNYIDNQLLPKRKKK